MPTSSQAPESFLHDTTAVILAGGFGTRLASMVPNLPKPMASVDGRPFLEYLLDYIRDSGIEDVILCLCHQADVIESHFGDGRRFGLRICYSRETSPRGTGGALRLASHLLKTDVAVILNGDSFCPVDLGLLVAANRDSKADLTLTVTRVADSSRYGSLEFDPHTFCITGFQEKSAAPALGGWINAGIYAGRRPFLLNLPDKFPCSLEKEVFPDLCLRHGLSAFPCECPFLDIGTPESYQMSASFFRALRVHARISRPTDNPRESKARRTL
jgi:NDP-sugar pyrophosphorylase family protein